MINFGRTMRDFIPILPGKYTWTETCENRDIALAKQHLLCAERLSENIRKFPQLPVGDQVRIQNV